MVGRVATVIPIYLIAFIDFSREGLDARKIPNGTSGC